jgi:hypothetical protein
MEKFNYVPKKGDKIRLLPPPPLTKYQPRIYYYKGKVEINAIPDLTIQIVMNKKLHLN